MDTRQGARSLVTWLYWYQQGTCSLFTWFYWYHRGARSLVTWFYWYRQGARSMVTCFIDTHQGTRFLITWFHWYQPGARFLVTCFHTSLVPVLLSHGFINTSSNKATVYQRVTSVYQTVTSSTNAAVYQTVTSTYQTAIQCFLLYPIQTFICVWTPSLTKWVTKSYGPCLRNPSVIALNITRSLN